jgi:hypothetical protein
MAKENNNYQLLIEKLDSFIRKFYMNQIIRGFLYFFALVLILFLGFTLLEHQFYFSGAIRKIFFFSFIAASLGSLVYWLLIPMSKYFRLGKTISHEQAALIIGQHFYDVKDKLLNILQLRKLADSAQQKELIEASINQKSERIKLVPFRSAIDLQKNRKYLKYALPPFLLLLVILFAAPSLIKDSTTRIIKNNTTFERDAPFSFVLEEENPSVVQYSDYTLKIKMEGLAIPNEVFIDIDNYQYRLKKTSPNQFEYVFKNVQNDVPFYLFSGKYSSQNFTLDVLEKPNLVNFSLELDYPAYTGQRDEVLQNIGDVIIPQGTEIQWLFTSQKTDKVQLSFSSQQDLLEADRQTEEQFVFDRSFLKDEVYKVFISNAEIPIPDSIIYSIGVVPDKFPLISVQPFLDSTELNTMYFVGQASDDYGMRSIAFNYQIIRENGTKEVLISDKMSSPKEKSVSYDYMFDISELGLNPGDQLVYYFEVFDNDGINGSKSSKTGVMRFAKPSVDELKKQEEENDEQIKEALDETIEESKKIQDELKKLREKLLQKKELDWEDRKELEKLLEKQKELEEKLKEAKEKFEENLKNQESIKEEDPEMQEKQEKMQEMFEELVNDEMQELMDQIQELLQELDKEDAIQMMEEFEMEDQTMEKEMDRLLELYKQLELEKEVNDLTEELEKLAEQQEELAEKTEADEQNNESEDLQKEQEEINEAFEKLEEKLEEIEEKNEELDRPKDLGEDNQEQMEEIGEDLEQSQQELGNNENQKASESQKKAAQKMKKMAGNLQSQMESGEMEQMEEDMQALRQLLENLIGLSFDQEDLVSSFSKTKINTPRYVSLVQDQYKLKEDFKLIQDSLEALSMRNMQIETFVIEKITEVNRNLEQSVKSLEDRQKSIANDHQRKTMTNVNDLALMLNETMNQMQQQMSSMMSGSQMCQKPGSSPGQKGKSGKVPMDKITKGQEGLNEQMKGMMKSQKEGKGGKEGKNGSMSKEFAQAAARQASLRKALEEIQKEKMEQGKGSQALQELIDEMDKIETDLVNKRLNQEMLKRQQNILTRLLEADRAERQREKENQREAKQASDKSRKYPPAIDEYIKKREAEIDVYKTVSPSLRPYYKFLVESYYQSLKNDK